jgi:hypothetical protein
VTDLDWTRPEGMDANVARAWRAFYTSIRSRYGMSPAQYRALYLAQLGRCYGCWDKRGIHPDDPRGAGTRRLAIDHNHAYGNRIEAVRGLLCGTGDLSCNRILGALRDRPEALERLAHHLRTMPAQATFRALEAGRADEEIQGMAYRVLT